MLIIRDGICYIDSDNLTRYPIPSTVRLDKEFYDRGEYAKIFDPITVLYFKTREDMIDYDEVSILSEVELDTMIYNIKLKIEKIGEEWINASSYRRDALMRSADYRNNFRNLNYKYYELLDYKNNREDKDKEITKITKSKTKTKEL